MPFIIIFNAKLKGITLENLFKGDLPVQVLIKQTNGGSFHAQHLLNSRTI